MTLPEPLTLRWYDYYDQANEALGRQDADLWNVALTEVGGDSTYRGTYDEDMAVGRRPDVTPYRLIALDGDRVVGVAGLWHRHTDNVTEGNIGLCVAAEWRRRGVGTSMLEAIADRARVAGITRLSGWPMTATGHEPLGERFAAARGFTSHDVSRMSQLALPVGEEVLAPLQVEADAAHGDRYTIKTAVNELPEEWVEDLAMLHRRMSTDAPHTVEREEQQITPEYLRDRHERSMEAGIWVDMAVARDLDTGGLVGYSLLVIQGREDRAQQDDTLVLREHRGHRLGLALKLATLRELQAAHPEVRFIVTGNDATNAPMLAVNHRLGFTDTARLANWIREV